jgi:hypothetical protein
MLRWEGCRGLTASNFSDFLPLILNGSIKSSLKKSDSLPGKGCDISKVRGEPDIEIGFSSSLTELHFVCQMQITETTFLFQQFTERSESTSEHHEGVFVRIGKQYREMMGEFHQNNGSWNPDRGRVSLLSRYDPNRILMVVKSQYFQEIAKKPRTENCDQNLPRIQIGQ